MGHPVQVPGTGPGVPRTGPGDLVTGPGVPGTGPGDSETGPGDPGTGPVHPNNLQSHICTLREAEFLQSGIKTHRHDDFLGLCQGRQK